MLRSKLRLRGQTIEDIPADLYEKFSIAKKVALESELDEADDDDDPDWASRF